MNFSLRDYQQRARAEFYGRLSRGSRAPLIISPTGSGKTILALFIILDYIRHGRRVLFLAHRTELISQISEKLDACAIDHAILKAGMERGSFADLVILASVQTFTARMPYVPGDFDLIITDEAHHRVAATYNAIIAFCRRAGADPTELGLTATGYRTDGTGLGHAYDCIIHVTDTAELTERGYLVPLRVFRAPFQPDLFGVATKGGDYVESDLAPRMNKPKLLGSLVQEYARHAHGRRAIYFPVDCDHSRAIVAAFNATGLPAEHLDCETPDKQRRDILTRLATGQTLIVSSYGVLTEGFDCPAVACIGAARPTQSRCVWRQATGRGLRPSDGKRDCLLLDHAGWTETHGKVTDPDAVTLADGLKRGGRSGPGDGSGGGFDRPIDLGDPSVILAEDGSAPIRQHHALVKYVRPQPPRAGRLRSRGKF